MEISTLVSIAGGVREWFKDLREGRAGHRTRHNAALLALYAAANETQIYVNRQAPQFTRRPPPARDLAREEKLSRMWREASVLVREFDHDLAERCFDKGGYWTDPEAWSEQEIKAARIELKRVVEEARELLWA